MLYVRPPAEIDHFGSSAFDQAFLDEWAPWSPALAQANHSLVTRAAEGLPRRRFTAAEVEAIKTVLLERRPRSLLNLS